MKKLLLAAVGLCMLMSFYGCGSQTKNESKETEGSKEPSTQEVTESKEDITTEKPTETEKIYDTYINGQGFNIGDKLQANLILTTDLAPLDVCASFVIYMDGENDSEKIKQALGFDPWDGYSEPTIYIQSASDITSWEGNPVSGLWAWYANIDGAWYTNEETKSENPEPIYKFDDGQVILEVDLTVNEKGNYTIEGKSGNQSDEPSLIEEFELYKDAYSIELIRK